jgi:trafficking protein particle complex subunit 11
VHDFVGSLQAALQESAQDYYREHSRRVRRKRSRYPPPLSVWQPVANAQKALSAGNAQHEPIPLSREGWHVRAEIKLATFAEMAGDAETAMKHYLEAYETLAGNRCLGSTSTLPPRTKRWAEAKVLVDTVNIRIARLHLYEAVVAASSFGASDAPSQALPPQQQQKKGLPHIASAMSQFHRHIRRFTELSTGWGIGDATFEFWSWLSKQ